MLAAIIPSVDFVRYVRRPAGRMTGKPEVSIKSQNPTERWLVGNVTRRTRIWKPCPWCVMR